MSNSAHHRRKRKKKSRFKNLVLRLILSVLTVFLLAAVIGSVIFFTGDYYDDTKNELDKLSYPRKYSEYVDKAANDYDLDPALIYAVIRTESEFDPNAYSEAGACGIMQIMPSTFEWLTEKRGTEGEYSSDDLYDPEICIDYGSYLLKYLYDYYGNEQCAVAAYNAGFVVSDWLGDSSYSSDGKTLDDIPYPETESYVKKVESAKEKYLELYYK